MATGYVFDPVFLKHTQPGHPENAGRLEAILKELESSGLLEALHQIPSRAASVEELAYVHDVAHIEQGWSNGYTFPKEMAEKDR